VLDLGAAKLSTDLDPTLGLLSDLGQSHVAKVCAALDPTVPNAFIVPEPNRDALDVLAHAAPPCRAPSCLPT
jgi:hypothetical protein